MTIKNISDYLEEIAPLNQAEDFDNVGLLIGNETTEVEGILVTLDTLEETEIHVGDTFRVGECILEATKQRDPCVKLGVRFNDMNIVKQFWNTTMCGVYFKVIQTGNVTTGDTFELIKKSPENPTISDLYVAKRLRKGM